MADARQFVFGPGLAWAELQTYLDTGIAPVIARPVRFDVTQSFSVDFTLNPKELYGQNVFPTAIGIGQGKVTGKIIGGRINSRLLNSTFYGASTAITAGSNAMAIDEKGLIPDTPGPYTIVVAHSAQFVKDWNVRFSDGTYLDVVNSPTVPTTGQYSVTSGTYTFAAADKLRNVLIDYEYTVNPAAGETFEVDSFFQGLITLYGLRYQGTFNGKNVGIWIPNAVGNKFTYNSKQQDFVLPEYDFQAFAGPDNIVAQLYLTE